MLSLFEAKSLLALLCSISKDAELTPGLLEANRPGTDDTLTDGALSSVNSWEPRGGQNLHSQVTKDARKVVRKLCFHSSVLSWLVQTAFISFFFFPSLCWIGVTWSRGCSTYIPCPSVSSPEHWYRRFSLHTRLSHWMHLVFHGSTVWISASLGSAPCLLFWHENTSSAETNREANISCCALLALFPVRL